MIRGNSINMTKIKKFYYSEVIINITVLMYKLFNDIRTVVGFSAMDGIN